MRQLITYWQDKGKSYPGYKTACRNEDIKTLYVYLFRMRKDGTTYIYNRNIMYYDIYIMICIGANLIFANSKFPCDEIYSWIIEERNKYATPAESLSDYFNMIGY
jgi:hypothetical protein